MILYSPLSTIKTILNISDAGGTAANECNISQRPKGIPSAFQPLQLRSHSSHHSIFTNLIVHFIDIFLFVKLNKINIFMKQLKLVENVTQKNYLNDKTEGDPNNYKDWSFYNILYL